MTRITRRQAAQIALRAQMLDRPNRRKATRDDVRNVIRRLGVIQIDTISVVARSHYVIPWSRIGAYDPDWIDELHFPDREIFEYWGHAASLLDISLLPCFLSRMEEYRRKWDPSHFDWTAENHELINHVRERIRDEGPLSSLAFERPSPEEPVEPWAWYGGKPTNRILDYLWRIGELGIHRRIGFRREYDLIERVHPEILEIDPPTLQLERLTLADRALQAMGIARPEWLNDYFRTSWGQRNDQPPGPVELLQTLADTDRAIPVEIEGLGPAWVSIDQEDALNDVLNGFTGTFTSLLSPFDNLVWDRRRTLELFDFEYRIEIYTPGPQRIYGYFNLPILRRGSLIGRLDPKVDRRSGLFSVNSLHLEPGVRVSDRLISDIRGTLQSFARWNGAREIQCLAVAPELAEALNGLVAAR